MFDWNVIVDVTTDGLTPLAHLLLDKMAASWADDISNCIFFNENDGIPIQISLNMFPGIELMISQHWFR